MRLKSFKLASSAVPNMLNNYFREYELLTRFAVNQVKDSFEFSAHAFIICTKLLDFVFVDLWLNCRHWFWSFKAFCRKAKTQFLQVSFEVCLKILLLVSDRINLFIIAKVDELVIDFLDNFGGALIEFMF